MGRQFLPSPDVLIEPPRSDTRTAEKAAKSRLHDRGQGVGGNCRRWGKGDGAGASRSGVVPGLAAAPVIRSSKTTANRHGLAGLPGRRVVPHEVPRHLLEPLPGGDDVVVALELPLQALRHVDVAGRFERLQLPRRCARSGPRPPPPACRRGRRSRGARWPRPPPRALEVTDRDVVAEHPPRELVAGEQRRAGKADPEDAQPAPRLPAFAHRRDGPVHAEELVVTGEDSSWAPRRNRRRR